jgi:hypothetical protein
MKHDFSIYLVLNMFFLGKPSPVSQSQRCIDLSMQSGNLIALKPQPMARGTESFCDTSKHSLLFDWYSGFMSPLAWYLEMNGCCNLLLVSATKATKDE